VRGLVTAGPTCPVERPDEPCSPRPVSATVVRAYDRGGRPRGSATTDDAGRYSIGLVPGSYTVRVITDRPFPSCPETPVTVTRGPPIVADIVCDSGIR